MKCVLLLYLLYSGASLAQLKLQKPLNNTIYHAAYPDFGSFEDEVTAQKIVDFENLAGKNITWAYFSDNWFDGIHFPSLEVATISNFGRVPFIRIMPRNMNEDTPDPVYFMQAFLDGNFDVEITQWAVDAKATGIPLLIEFGTEVNGNWFGWNGQYAGAGNTMTYGDPLLYDGAERFRDVYRHIIDLFNAQNVDNVTWFFHINVENAPDILWNKMKYYYPGDSYIDWIGVSVYGPQDNLDGWWSFESLLSTNWAEINQISSTGKPIAILELGVIDDNSLGDKASWISDAYASVKSGGQFYPNISAMSWWHENFDLTNLRIDTSVESLAAYQTAIASNEFISDAQFANLDVLFVNSFE